MNHSKQIENLLYNINFLKNKFNFTTKQMAEILEISEKSMSIIENNELPNNFYLEAVCNMMDFFYLSLNQLLEKKIEK